MKPCTVFQTWRRKTTDGTLTPEAAAEFERHCSSCSDCARSFQAEQAMQRALRQAGELRAPEGFNQRVWNRIRATASEAPPQRAWMPAWGWAMAAAAGFVLVAAAYIFLHRAPGQAFLRQVQVAPRAVATAPFQPVVLEPRVAASAPTPKTMERGPAVAVHPAAPATAATPETVSRQELAEQHAAPEKPPEKPMFAPRPEALAPVAHGVVEAPVQHAAAAQPLAAGTGEATLARGTLRVRPNKFNPGRGEQALLEMNLEKNGRVEARVYSREGRLVRTLAEGEFGPGYTALAWNGANDQGQTVAAGIYVLLVRGPGIEQKLKLAVIR